jgi:hypothetical protein
VQRAAVATIEELWDSLDGALLDRVQFLLSLPQTSKSEPERLADTLVSSVLDWRLESITRLLSEVEQLHQEAEALGDQDALEIYRLQVRQLHVEKLQLNRARGAMSASGKRRAQDAQSVG